MPDTSPLILFARKAGAWSSARLGQAAKHKLFRRTYPLLALLVLLVSTLYWAILGAKLQIGNADQLADPYMFQSWATFHGAVFPGAHSFLLKWPIFWLIGIFGISMGSLLVATIAVCICTVAGLAYVLYRIDRRPLVFGTVCIALAFALLLVPALPYAGGLLPASMAMLTTRNIEYLVYIASLIMLIRAQRMRSRYYVSSIALLSLLIASDKLFLSLSLGGAVLALVVYALVQRWDRVTIAVRWLVSTVAAAILSTLLLFIIPLLHLTHFANEAGANPYSLVTGVKDVVLGVVYAVLGFLTNFGANPVYDNREIAHLPDEAFHRLLSFSGLLHVVAFLIVAGSLLLTWRFLKPALSQLSRRGKVKTDIASELSLALIWSTVAAFAVFIATHHYYPVDARYLTVSVFAVAITVATSLRQLRFRRPERLIMVGIVLFLGAAGAGWVAHTTYRQQAAALTTVNNRNTLIAQALTHHKVDVVVGDYWRVLPVRFESRNTVNVLPLGGCTQPRDTLTSSDWQPNLVTHSFAYLISFDGSLAGFPPCSLSQVTAAYGRPNATQLISGTLAKPKEVLLFYDHGRHQNPPLPRQASAASAILPITLDQLIGTNCTGPTVMNVVAHEDDDILFTNPDLLHDIHAGHCIRTIYLTAGDAGFGKFYWLNRQLGAEAAYDSMLGYHGGWLEHTVELAAGEYVTIASPQNNPKISLTFFNLPDGDIHGDGFASSHHETLAKLADGSIDTLHTVDGQSHYTSRQLVTALANLMDTYQPAEIRTQADVTSTDYPDHSDHITTGKIATNAASLYDQQQFEGAVTIPVKYYIGYPGRGYPVNVSGGDLSQKEAAFFAYAKYDGGVCRSVQQCAQTPTYEAYLSRQYQISSSQ